MNAVIKFVPNLLTLLNALCGVVACYLVSLSVGNIPVATTVMLLGSIPCDMLDGFLARLLRVQSPIGIDLDSLADVISFGVAPALILSGALRQSGFALPWIALIPAPFSVYRLAKFNHDDRQKNTFIGLPTPAAALYCVGAAATVMTAGRVTGIVLALSAVVVSFLLVSEVPMFGFKSIAKWSLTNKILIVLSLIVSALLLAFYGYSALLWIMGSYIIFNVIRELLRRVARK